MILDEGEGRARREVGRVDLDERPIPLGEVREGRGDAPSTVDKELRLLFWLPDVARRFVLGALRWLDERGLLPRAVVQADAFHASMFVANLGSLQLDAGYHHLYEWGTIPIFCVIGQTKEVPLVRDGALVVGRQAVLRFTYDERIEDGLYAGRALQHLRGLVEDPDGAGAGDGWAGAS